MLYKAAASAPARVHIINKRIKALMIMRVIDFLNENVLWGVPMLVLMFGCGACIMLATRGAFFIHPVKTAGEIKRLLLQRDGGNGGITPLQAVSTALAGTLGTGNIIGVALAVSIGGPGSIFWMWVAALFGMVIKYSEVALAAEYRRTLRDDNGNDMNVGGPMYYMRDGLGRRGMAVWFCIAAIISSFGIGSSVQSNSLAGSAKAAFGINEELTAVIVSALTAMILIGGIRRIAGIAQVLVPVMSVIYIAAAVAVIIANAREIPGAFAMILHDAFKGSAAAGGFAGATAMQACRLGMSRGVFTNEAGLGSAPIAHAAGNAGNPARQGLLGAFEVFIDTIVMCTLTALAYIVTDAWKSNEGAAGLAAAFDSALPYGIGSYAVAVSVMLFTFATIPAWYYYGEKCVEFLSGGRWITLYKAVYTAFVYFGAVAQLDKVWSFADFSNGMMAVPNLIALLMLIPRIKAITADFFS